MDLPVFTPKYVSNRLRATFGIPRYVFFSSALIGTLCLLVIALLVLISPPQDFPLAERVEIPHGTSLVESVRILKEHNVIRSSLALQVLLIGRQGEPRVLAGTYQFTEPLSVFSVARAVADGAYGVPLLRLTIPEGFDNKRIDALATDILPNVEEGDFLAAAEGKEGYLFPDTYHVPETFTATDLVELMEETFEEQFGTLAREVRRSGRTPEEIVVMASILEREGNSEESMQVIAGILWERIRIGMPLQVDASFAYLLEKTSAEVTYDDIALDSPYNTYRYPGLPPAPIGNPGMRGLRAALDPVASPYLFYLSSPDGTFHYAQTYEEHQENKVQHLN